VAVGLCTLNGDEQMSLADTPGVDVYPSNVDISIALNADWPDVD
jgi:hypothetical protein